MPGVSRRHLLAGALAGAGGALASQALPPALAKAAAAGPPKSGSLRDVKNVVVLMQENRSFDHYFGTLAGVRGFSDPNALVQPNGRSIFHQPDPFNPDGYLLPFHLDTHSTSAQAIPSTSHAWTYQHDSLNIRVSEQAGQPTSATNDAWIPSHYKADGPDNYWYVMGYYERQDIPFQFALAETFTLCDAYHCSLLGPTWPNRMYLMTGMIDPLATGGGPIISNVVPSSTTGRPYTWTTYPERLTAAGISWRVYQEEDDYGTNPLEWFDAYQSARPGSPLYDNALTIYPADRFEWDAKHDRLPTVSWILPTSSQSEHPAYLPASGANFLASKLNAVAENQDLWSRTVFIINYDENDGLFDHVVPPLPPAGTPAEFVDGVPIGGGVRVPCIIVSPWSVGGYVATEQFDHTSVLQFLEKVTGVREPNISQWRREVFGDLTSTLGFSHGKTTTFPQRLPHTMGRFWQAEHEVATLPPATIPGADQVTPRQETHRPRLPWTPQPHPHAMGTDHGALPGTTSRYQENRTTHAADFTISDTDKVYLHRIAAVEHNSPATLTGTSFAYVPGVVGGNIAIVDTTTRELAKAVTSGAPAAAGAPPNKITNPYGVAATPDGTQIWVTESGTNTVSIIDTSTKAITSTVVAGVYPHGIAISPDGRTAYVANTGPNTGHGGSQTVSVLDVATHKVTNNLTVGEAPQMVTVSPDGSMVLVTCADGVYAVTASNGHVHKVPRAVRHAQGVAFAPDSRQAYIADPEHDQVLVLRTAPLRVTDHIKVGATPWGVAFNADGTKVYVTNANSDTVSVVNTHTRTVDRTVDLGSNSEGLNHIPTAATRSPQGDIWITCNVSSSLAIIDTTTDTITASVYIGLGDAPTGIAFAS